MTIERNELDNRIEAIADILNDIIDSVDYSCESQELSEAICS